MTTFIFLVLFRVLEGVSSIWDMLYQTAVIAQGLLGSIGRRVEH